MDCKARRLCWKLMLMQPREVTRRAVEAAVRQLREKKAPPGLAGLRFESYEEGIAVQILYVGPYAEESPTVERLLRHAEGQGFEVLGPHHEIYLSDPRRTKPERLKTVIRYAVVGRPRSSRD